MQIETHTREVLYAEQAVRCLLRPQAKVRGVDLAVVMLDVIALSFWTSLDLVFLLS